MNASKKILYFVMGVVFAAGIGLSLYRPLEAMVESVVNRKVHILSGREMTRIQKDITALEQSIQDDRDFLTAKYTGQAGKGSWSAQYGQRKNDIEQNLPGREKKLQEFRAQLQTLRM